jgi:hypothetical protein
VRVDVVQINIKRMLLICERQRGETRLGSLLGSNYSVRRASTRLVGLSCSGVTFVSRCRLAVHLSLLDAFAVAVLVCYLSFFIFYLPRKKLRGSTIPSGYGCDVCLSCFLLDRCAA